MIILSIKIISTLTDVFEQGTINAYWDQLQYNQEKCH